MKYTLLILALFFVHFHGSCQRVRAVVVGVADYQYDRKIEGLNDLSFCDDDAQEFYNFLINRYPESKGTIVLLKDRQATTENVFKAMIYAFRSNSEDDQLIFFFSGHGSKGYFLPYDYDDTADHVLFHKDVRSAFSLSRAKRKMVFADACRAGSANIQRKPYRLSPTIKKYFQKLKREKQGIFLMMSSRWNENSRESGRLRNGYFAYYLLKGLKGRADKNNDNSIVVDELYSYVRKQVRSDTENEQTPIIFGQFSGKMVVAKIKD